MKFSTGKRIGQSGQELLTAAVFSFVLHTCALAAAALLYFSSPPKVSIPPFYDVKLVGLPAQVPAENPAPPAPPAPAPARPAPKPAPKAVRMPPAEHKAPPHPSRSAMPDLGREKSKPEKPQPSKRAEPSPAQARPQPQTAPAAPVHNAAPASAASGARVGNVTAGEPQDFRFPEYGVLIRDRIGDKWNPPKGALEIKAKVQFTILRSGRVGDVKLAESSGNFYFDQAAVRAILMSSPFPPLPEGFFKESEVFTVDLTGDE